MVETLRDAETAMGTANALATRDDLGALAAVYATDLIINPNDLVLKSDKLIRLSREIGHRLPSLSAIHGAEFVRDLPKREVHKYVYSDEFNDYAQVVLDQTQDEAVIERHFFTHGIEAGLWLKALRAKTSYGE